MDVPYLTAESLRVIDARLDGEFRDLVRPGLLVLDGTWARLEHELRGLARELALASEKMDFSAPDAAPEDLLNRVIWHSVKGYHVPYPAAGR